MKILKDFWMFYGTLFRKSEYDKAKTTLAEAQIDLEQQIEYRDGWLAHMRNQLTEFSIQQEIVIAQKRKRVVDAHETLSNLEVL